MILKKIEYCENEGNDNYWCIKDVNLCRMNMIVGLNAVGKTRLINIISNFAKILKKKFKPNNGTWNLEFGDMEDKENYKYELKIEGKGIAKEKIIQAGKVLLEREGETGKIWSFIQSKMIEINPPKEELVLAIRRDKVEFPFLEDLYGWADSFHGFTFNMSSNEIRIPQAPETETILTSLSTVPYILEKALKRPKIKEKIIEDLCGIGYPISDVGVNDELIPGLPPGITISKVQETDLKCVTQQFLMSNGMFRAFALVVIIEYILDLDERCTVAIDDLAEGLDYDRAAKLTKLLFERVQGSKIQLLVASNARFLINNTKVEYLNILERQAHVVRSFNYGNSKEMFEEFKTTGLSSFDFFTGKMYKESNAGKG